MGFTLEHIHRSINSLGRLMPAKPNKDSTREYSLKECIFLMAPQLLEKREMGCTANELVKALMDDGIEIKAPTLNRYLCDYQKIPGEEPQANPPKKQKPQAQAAPPSLPLATPESAEKPKQPLGQSAPAASVIQAQSALSPHHDSALAQTRQNNLPSLQALNSKR
jgi:DNA segregation ATPase FtsK/SpoIIIE-like protein